MRNTEDYFGIIVGNNKEGDCQEPTEMEITYKIALDNLKKYIQNLNSSKNNDHSMNLALDIIDQSAFYLNLNTKIKSLAYNIFSEMRTRGLVRTQNAFLCALTSVYVVCRRVEIPITLNDLAHVMDASRKGIAKEFRNLIYKTGIIIPRTKIQNFIFRYVEELHISSITKELACSLLHIAEKKKITTGKDPAVIATALIYIACLYTNEVITQRELSNTALVSEVSIRNNYKKIISVISRADILQLTGKLLLIHEGDKKPHLSLGFDSEIEKGNQGGDYGRSHIKPKNSTKLKSKHKYTNKKMRVLKLRRSGLDEFF